jgi:hypothetical protein
MSNLPKRAAFLCVSVAVTCVTFSPNIHAEHKARVDSTAESNDYEYKFDDDGLLGSTLANTGDIFAGRKRFQRVLLIRPRTDLRPHMYKSVENL